MPTNSPASYNDVASWGIVPAWGYAIVIGSTTTIPEGTVVWGFWPTSTAPVDLQLKATEPKGHWIEITETRQNLMSTYNRYMEVPNSPVSSSAPDFGEDQLEHMAWNALFRGVWEGAYLLSQYVFSPDPQNQTPIPPLGMGMAWTATDADLASAIVVSLSASSKTARAFTYHLSQRPKAGRPLGLLQVTSSPNPISKAAENLQVPFPTKTVAYDDVHEPLDWMAGLKASKIVIADFGARANTLSQLLDSINKHTAMHSPKISIIPVGSQQKVRGPAQEPPSHEKLLHKPIYLIIYAQNRSTARKSNPRPKKQCRNSARSNTTPPGSKTPSGAEAYFDTLTHRWDEYYCARGASAPDLRRVEP